MEGKNKLLYLSFTPSLFPLGKNENWRLAGCRKGRYSRQPQKKQLQKAGEAEGKGKVEIQDMSCRQEGRSA